jgi:hypothetical protein
LLTLARTRAARAAHALGAVLAVGALALAAPAPAAASFDWTVWGVHGRSSIRDAATTPGVSCAYENGRLARMYVFPPTVYAYDRTTGLDQQQVNVRVALRHLRDDGRQDNGTYGNGDIYMRTFPQYASATDQTPASLGTTTIELGSWPQSGRYFADLEIRWTKPGSGDVEGGRIALLQYYRQYVDGRFLRVNSSLETPGCHAPRP